MILHEAPMEPHETPMKLPEKSHETPMERLMESLMEPSWKPHGTDGTHGWKHLLNLNLRLKGLWKLWMLTPTSSGAGKCVFAPIFGRFPAGRKQKPHGSKDCISMSVYIIIYNGKLVVWDSNRGTP